MTRRPPDMIPPEDFEGNEDAPIRNVDADRIGPFIIRRDADGNLIQERVGSNWRAPKKRDRRKSTEDES